MIGGNGIQRELGTIIAKLDAMEQKDRDYREDIKQLYGTTGTNTNSIGKAHTRLDDMKEDIGTIQKKSTLLGGGAGGALGFAGSFIKDLFGGN